jgi:hypothetical protein
MLLLGSLETSWVVLGSASSARDELLDAVSGDVVNGRAGVGPPEDCGKVNDDHDRDHEYQTNHLSEPPFVGPCN